MLSLCDKFNQLLLRMSLRVVEVLVMLLCRQSLVKDVSMWRHRLRVRLAVVLAMRQLRVSTGSQSHILHKLFGLWVLMTIT